MSVGTFFIFLFVIWVIVPSIITKLLEVFFDYKLSGKQIVYIMCGFIGLTIYIGKQLQNIGFLT